MKIAFICSAGLLALSAMTTANAADLPMPVKAPPPPPPFSWTGFYIGGNGGYGWANESSNLTLTTTLGTATLAGSGNGSGWLGGGQVGFNWEAPTHVVLGLEADGDWANISGSSSGCSIFTTGAHIGSASGCGTDNVRLNDFFTLRGRFGWAWENVFFYGTGGFAWGASTGTHTTTCVSGFPPVCPGGSIPFTGGGASYSDNNLLGYAVGAGFEWAFLPHWTFRVEYLHIEFDNVPTSFNTTLTINAVTLPPALYNVSSNNGINIVRLGLNYLFNL